MWHTQSFFWLCWCCLPALFYFHFTSCVGRTEPWVERLSCVVHRVPPSKGEIKSNDSHFQLIPSSLHLSLQYQWLYLCNMSQRQKIYINIWMAGEWQYFTSVLLSLSISVFSLNEGKNHHYVFGSYERQTPWSNVGLAVAAPQHIASVSELLWAGQNQSSSTDSRSHPSVCSWAGPLQREGEAGWLWSPNSSITEWELTGPAAYCLTQATTIYPHQGQSSSQSPSLCSCQAPHSPLFSSTLTLSSVSIVFPSFITYQCHHFIPLFPAQWATTALLPDLSIPSPHLFFIFILQFNSSSQIFTDCLLLPFELITGFQSHSFTLNLGLSSKRRFACVGWRTQREKKSYNASFSAYLYTSQQWMVCFFFYFSHLKAQQPTPRCWAP